MTKEFEFSRRKALAALGTVGAASAGAGLGTSAFFSDQETFRNNSLVAGALDAKVAYSAHYSDWSSDEDDGVAVRMWEGNTDTTGGPADLRADETGLPTNDAWLVAVDDPDQFLANTQYSEAGDASCPDGSDAEDVEQPVIELEDVKPGDFGEVTIDFALCDNPGFVWLNGELRSADENDLTEPEDEDGNEDGDADSTDPVDVELLDAVQAAVWVDDGDSYQDDEVLAIEGSLRTVLNELGTGPGLAFGGNVDSGDGLGRNCFSPAGQGAGTADVHSISVAWWLPVDHANEIQTDAVTFDLGLYTEQCRHNEGTAVDLTELVSTPRMQQLLSDLGHPAPSDLTVDAFGSLGPVELRFDQSRTRRFNQNSDQTPTTFRTIVPSPVGQLVISSTEDRLFFPPAFIFDEDIPTQIKNQLIIDGDIGWPDGVSSVIMSTDEASVFARDILSREKADIENSIDRNDVSEAFAYNSPERSIYSVSRIQPSEIAVPDGGTQCGIVPDRTCERFESAEVFVLDPEFELMVSRSFETPSELSELFFEGLGGNSPATNSAIQPSGVDEFSNGNNDPLMQCLENKIENLAVPSVLACIAASLALLVSGLPALVGAVAAALLALVLCLIAVGISVLVLSANNFIQSCAGEIMQSSSTPSQPGPIERSLNPKGTFLRADFNPPPPEIIDLSEVGLSPDDRITIEQTGDTTSQPGSPENRHSTIAVFSGSDRLLGPSNLNRVPDAIKAGTNAETPKTFFGNQPTDIPEDFRVTNFDGSVSSVTVTIPDGATHLFVGAEDSEPTDNRDPDGDYRVTITRG